MKEFFSWEYIKELLFSEFTVFWERTVVWLPRVVLAVLIFFLFKWLARKAQNLTYRSLRSSQKLSTTSKELIGIAVKILVWLIGFLIILEILKLYKLVLSMLAGFGLIGFALSFAFQDLATNLVSGIIIAFQRPFEVGEEIEIDGVFGRVKDIEIRNTVLLTPTGQIVTMPNRKLVENVLVNYSRLHIRRVDLNVAVSYGDDLKKVEKVILDTLKNSPLVKDKNRIRIFFSDFGDSSVNLTVTFWLRYKTLTVYQENIWEIVKALRQAFDENDITIPFPIRTLDFGVKGGTSLSEILKEYGKKET